jgi:hypothetical protein
MTADEVSDFVSFLVFVSEMAAERSLAAAEEAAKPGPYAVVHGWENISIEDFLGGAWASARHLHPEGSPPPEPSWQEFARFLDAGKVYQ